MSTIKIGKPVSTYKRYTPVQLAATIRQLQRQFVTVAKKSGKKPVKGTKSIQSQCQAIAREIRKVAGVLRTKIVQQINVKIRTLKTQYAKNLGVRVSSPKAYSAAAKRLKAKIILINKCNRASTLMNLCAGIKLSQYKNPAIKGSKRTSARKAGTRRTTRARKTTRRTPNYKRQHKTLKKELHKLKKRNSFMRRLVNQFRKKVAKLQRSYRAANAKPRWKVVKGTSNVVRFSRRSSPNWHRQAHRRAG